MTAETPIMGLFTDDAKAARAIRELPAQGFGFRRAHGPLPSRRIAEALGLKTSKVGWFTLAGGITTTPGEVGTVRSGDRAVLRWRIVAPVEVVVP